MTVVRKAVTWGLFGAWLVHDIEELATMPAWSRRAATRLAERYPRVPARAWSAIVITPTQAQVAIGAVGAVVAAAAADGARTGGRSEFYQGVLTAFGVHAVGHVAGTVAYRGYTPGVLTAPTVVAPFTVWAWRELRRADVPAASGSVSTVFAVVPVLAGAQLLGRLVSRRVARRRGVTAGA